MRVAVLADIHGNADALAAVLAEARDEGVEQLLLLGDYVGYHFESARTLELLAGWKSHAVRGNHDRALLEARSNSKAAAAYRLRYGPALDVALDELPPAALTWLETLPETLTVELAGMRLLLCHGSPSDPDQYVYWNSALEVLDRCAQVEADGVLMGHTHHLLFRPGTPWLLNPGSVGQARDLGGFASWCMFDTERTTFAFRRTPYDAAAAILRLRSEWAGSEAQQRLVARNNPALASMLDR